MFFISCKCLLNEVEVKGDEKIILLKRVLACMYNVITDIITQQAVLQTCSKGGKGWWNIQSVMLANGFIILNTDPETRCEGLCPSYILHFSTLASWVHLTPVAYLHPSGQNLWETVWTKTCAMFQVHNVWWFRAFERGNWQRASNLTLIPSATSFMWSSSIGWLSC